MTTDSRQEIIERFAQNDAGPVFSAPWHAQAFSMSVRLYEGGHFSWREWAQTLGAEIAAAKDSGEPDNEDAYYECWLRALEKLVVEKGLSSELELTQRRDAWDRAARATPHGQPIKLPD